VLANFTNATKLERIGEFAFESCGLTSVDFGGANSLTLIDDDAFYDNPSLTTLDFGGLTNLTIQSSAFNLCASLRQVNYQSPTLLNSLTPISGGQQHMYIQKNAGNNTVLAIDFQDAQNLTSIEDTEFIYQGQLNSLNNFINATSLLRIGEQAFSNCTNLQSVFFPNNLTAINDNSFDSNISLKSVWFGSTSPTSISNSAFTNCTSLKYIYYYGADTSQLNQLTSIANGTLYNLDNDTITYPDYDKISTSFSNSTITDENQKSDIKNNYAANIIQVALNGTIFNPVTPINVSLGAIPFLAEQLQLPPTSPLKLYPNYTTPTNTYNINTNTDIVYFQMNISSVLYLSTGQTITKNTDNTYTYSGNTYQPGTSITIQDRTIIFGGVTIGAAVPDLGTGIPGISPKPIILVERGNERGANREILRRAGFFNINTYTQSNPGNNVNYIIDSGIPVKNKTVLNKDSSERTRRLKLKAQNKTYNDPSFGGNNSNGSYSALSRVRH